MAFFALLWKARIIENYRLKYEKEKINSIALGNAQLEQTFSQRWRHYRFDTKKRISKFFKKLYPDGSVISNFFLYLMTDQTFPNFLFKSVMGFGGGIILTYLCFMFFVFQLAISLIHATIMSSIIGVLLTLGLAFSYRIRCLVFLLIPQFFSRVGRYTLTCYALVLILTGPATNTLKNSEVLSESMACSQEQIKTSVHQLNDLMKKPINAMKDSLKLMVDQLKMVTAKVKETVIRLDRLVLSIVNAIQSSFSWLQSIADICNSKLGTPYDRCCNAIQDGLSHCHKTLGPKVSELCDVTYVAQTACYSVKPFKAFCYAIDFMDEAILASVKKKLREFTDHLRAMFQVEVHIHHTYSYSSNTSRSASQVAAGIVTEIRNRADPMLTWLSWSSCVTSLFLLLIIFRSHTLLSTFLFFIFPFAGLLVETFEKSYAFVDTLFCYDVTLCFQQAKYYQHMYETRSRFDNRYVTKDLQALDLKRQQQGRETVLPLNRREREKYITPSSFHLVASEKVYLNRSAVFMAITTFKLLIHMVADYSLYWVLMTIRCHGRFQSDLMPGIPQSGAHVSGSGFVAKLFSSIIGILDIPLSFPAPSPITCLPDPYPPDLRRYTQIGVLIFLLWFFALFEPYGLRLRHLIMGHYRPERAKARATWLYNHILRTRGSFMKFARRKLHREYKYTSEASLTLSHWISDLVPFQCLRSLLGLGPTQQHCLLCGITSSSDPDSRLTKCQTPGCPGVFCISCFTDIGELCTICLSPTDYGDLSDVSLEKGSSDDSDSDCGSHGQRMNENITFHSTTEIERTAKSTRTEDENRRWGFFKKTSGPGTLLDTLALVQTDSYINKHTVFTTFFLKRFRNFKWNVRKHFRVRKRTLDWADKLTHDNKSKYFSKKKRNSLDIKEFGEFDVVNNRTKSIGVNTNRNRGVFVNMIMNSFIRRKGKPRSRRKKAQRDLKQNKKGPVCRIKNNTEGRKRSFFATNIFQSYNFTTSQRNLKNIVRSKKDSRTKNRVKVRCKEPKGIMRAIRFKSKGIKNISYQKDANAPNNSSVEDNHKTTKPSDNTNIGGEKNKKKCSKDNKPKKSGKLKDNNKIKTKNSPNRIAEFHKFFSNHWNNFKSTIMPGNAKNRSDISMAKEKRNHKRRKKRKGVDLNETHIEKCFARKDVKQTRDLRISSFLAELEWTKRDFRKENDIEEKNDSFLLGLDAPVPTKTDKIIGMVQLRSMPFQWREAQKTCTYDKKYACLRKQSSSKLFESLSKQKLLAKKAIDRFRYKVKHSLPQLSSSMVPRVSNSMTGARMESHFMYESSICLTKRESLYRSFNPGWSEHSDILNTDLLFENTKYGAKLMQDHSQEVRTNLWEENSNLSSILEKEIVVSRSSISKEELPIGTKRCKCDFYDDLQRKWDHVKKSYQDLPGTKNPLSLLKNFCSSLFGQNCDENTCPARLAQRDRCEKQKNETTRTTQSHISYTEVELKNNTPRSIQTSDRQGKSFELSRENRGTETRITATAGIQTGDQKYMETQRTDKDVMKTIKSALCATDFGEPGKIAHKCTEAYLMPDAFSNNPPLVVERKNYEDKEVQGTCGCEVAAGLDCQSMKCPNYCHDEAQYELSGDRDVTYTKKKCTDHKAVGSFLCLCDKSVQLNSHEVCTCATQHVSGTQPPIMTCRRLNTVMKETTPVRYAVNKKTQHRVVPEVAHKGTYFKPFRTDAKSGEFAINQQLPLEKNLIAGCGKNVAQMKEELTDTISDTTESSESSRSDDSKTDTTICSLATINYDSTPRRRRFRTKVVTKTNQSTLTDKTKVCDTGMVTDDWWSPIVERRANDAIRLEKKRGFNVIEMQKKKLQELKGLKEMQDLKGMKELREIRTRRKNCGMTTDGRNVTFRSTTQIIPAGLFHGKDIMSPSRYLLESQKYYNELFANNYRPRSQMVYNYVTHVPKLYEKEKNRSSVGSRRNHQHKTKRLDECYSPRRQVTPRKRISESTKTSDSPRRKHRQDRQSNNRHAKISSPRKRV